ncbi:MAG TPA: mechanosensitive ion channel family protein [Terriglobia bacterium]|nr:mechanosensitive ion channel family protein [Terriglobia bacterium]
MRAGLDSRLDPLRDLAHLLRTPLALIDIAAVLVLLTAALVIGLGLRHICRRYARRLQNSWGEFFFALLEPLPIPLLILAALYTAVEEFNLPRRWDHLASQAILVTVIIVLFFFPARVVHLFLTRMSRKQPQLERVTQPANFLVKILFSLVAVIVILENLGVHLTAVWTTLGVGSVAVALALQDTLGNFFAGLYILADHPVNLNDYIRLDTGQEGFVTRIGWRSTLLRTGQNNMVVVPNSTLAKAVITNFSFPEERLLVSVPVSVAYGTDPRRVERILVEIAGGLAEENFPGLLGYTEPSALLLPGFGASTLDFTLYVSVRRFADQGRVQSELRRRILERFAKEGIEMPFPTRALVLDPSLLGLLPKAPEAASSGPVAGVIASKKID